MQIFTSNYITKSISSLILVIRHLKTLVLLNSTGRQEPIPRKSWLFVSGMKTLSLLLLCLSLGFTGSVFAQANFVASPASVSINPGDPFSVTIALQTVNDQAVDGAEIHLDFEPSILQVTNVTALSNSQLPTEILGAPTFDNSTGTISYVAGNVSSPPLANFDFLQIDFQAIGSVNTSIDYDFTFPFSFTDITLAGSSVFGTAASIPVTIVGINQPPVFNNTIANQTNNEQDIVVALDASANDPDGNSISYEATNLPAGLSIDANGFISGTIDLGASNGGSLNTGVYAVVITATDDGASPLSNSQNFQWTVTTPTVPTYTITASAGDNGSIDPLTATVNEGSDQTFNFTPDAGFEVSEVLVGGTPVSPIPTTSYTITNVTATTNISVSFSLIAIDTAPEITLAATATLGEGGTINVPLSISDADGDNLTVSITSVSNEPQELQTTNAGVQTDPYPFDATNFLTESSVSNAPGSYSSSLDFTPQFGDGGSNGDGSGVYTVTVQVDDEDGNSITKNIDVTVTDVAQFITDTGITRLEAESYDDQGNSAGGDGIGVEVGIITNIGFTTNGDFAEYMIDVQTAGTYQFDFYVSKNSATTHTMTINGGPAFITVPNYNDWADYSNVVSANVILSAGSQTLRFDWTGAAGNYFNIDYFEATKVTDEPFQLCIASGNNDLTAYGRSFIGDPNDTPPTGLGFARTNGKAFGNGGAIVAGTTPGSGEETLYRQEIYGGAGVGNPSYTYDIPVTNGVYQIDLYFAEVYGPITNPGQRVFDVILEGNPILDEYDLLDPIKDGLPNKLTAIIRTYNVEVTDGSLSLQMGPASVDNGKLSGICVTEVSSANLHPVTAIGDLTYDALVAVADPLNIVDPENDELSIVFNGLPASLSYDPTTNQIQGTPLATDANTYTINAIISDGTNSPVTEEFTLVINPVVGDNPPTIDAIADVEVNEGELLSQAITVTDDNLPAATIEVFDVSAGGTNNPFNPTTSVAVGTLDDNTGGSYTFNWTPDAGTGRSYLARVTAADGVNAPVIEEFRINVAQQLPGTILARTFNNPVPWYGSSAPDASNGYSVAIETSPAQNIGYIDNGDFVEYLVNVPVPGLFDLEVQAAKGNAGTTTVTFSENSGGGFTPIGSVGVVNNGAGWQDFAAYTTQVTFLNAGLQTLRLDFSAGANIAQFSFTAVSGNTAPVVAITSPADGIYATSDAGLSFTGTANDLDDGNLSASINWDSDLDGSLGTGSTITPTLSVGTHVITASATDLDGSNPQTGQASITINIVDPAPFCAMPSFRVNAGGPIVFSANGDFEEDQKATGPTNGTAQLGTPSPYLDLTAPAEDTTFGSNAPLVSNDTGYPDYLFQTERYSQVANPDNMNWTFPIGNGVYEVKMLFNENWTGEINSPRVFDVEIQGNLALDDYRPSGPTGSDVNVAKVETYTATVTDGVLNINFIKGTQNPSIKGFDICFVSDLPTDTPPVVSISSPTDNTTPISINRLVSNTFTAAVVDAEDDDTTLTNALVWSIDPFEANFAGNGGTFDETLFVPGVYTIRATSTDIDTNVAFDEIQVTVLGPDVNFTSPAENADVATTDVQVTWSATNMNYEGTTPEHFHLWVNPADPNNLVAEDRISTASVPGQLFWDLTAADGIVEGPNKVVIIAADNGHLEFLNAEARDEVNFTVLGDTTDPTITCLANIVVENDPGLCGAVVTFTAPLGEDDRPGAITTQTAGLASGDTFPVGTTTQTFLVTDAAGLTATCSFDVTVNDTEDPVLTCPTDDAVDVDINGEFILADYTSLAAVSDNCDNSFTVTQSPVAGTTLSADTQVTLSVTDNASNTGSCIFNVTISDDTTDPVISCPANIVVDNDPDQCGAVVTFTAPVGTDDRPGAITIQTVGLASGDTFPVGTTTQTFLVTDAAGLTATCSFDVTVNDEQAPDITCPANITRTSLNGNPLVISDLGTATAPDNCPGAVNIAGVTLIGDLPIPDTFPVGTTQIKWTAIDAAGNVAQCIQNITVNFTASSEKAITAFSLPSQVGPEVIAGTSVNLTVAAGTDLSVPIVPEIFEISLNATISPAANIPQIFNVPVQYTVTGQDNSAQIWTVNVMVEPDTEDPVVTCPGAITVANDAGVCGAVVTFDDATATDNVGVVSLSYSVPSGSLFAVGITTVVVTATDAADLTATCSFDVTVNDMEAPVVSCLVDQTELGDINGSFAIPDYTGLANALDNCDSSTLITQNPLPGTIISGTTLVTLTSEDTAGNSGSCTFNVVVGALSAASLGSFVWNDLDANGVQDAGEPGIPGALVTLLDGAGNPTGLTDTTGPNGEYLFSGLAPGEYIVRFGTPTDFNFSPANQGGNDAADSDAVGGETSVITLTSGENDLTNDAGFYMFASLGNYVWEDTNRNGINDEPASAGVEGVTANLRDENGNVIATTTTGISGLYEFTALTPGTYSVQFLLPNGFNFSPFNQGGDDALDSDADPAMNGGTADTNLESGENNETVDAGIRLSTPSQLIITPSSISRTLNVGASTMVTYVVDSDDASTLLTPAAMSIIDNATNNPATWASTTSAANQATSYEVNLDATGLAPGTYNATLTAGPVSGYTDASIPITLIVEAIPTVLSVTSFTLVNADNEQDIMTITNGMTINVATLPTLNLNIRANTTADVESVQMQLTGSLSQTVTENFAPYALYGDSSGNYAAKAFVIGNYSLTANPYSGSSLGGTLGNVLTVSFELSDQNTLCTSFNASLTAVTSPSTCSGVGSATAVPSGGVSPYTYQWDNGATSAIANNLSVGPHSVIVGDANGCTKTLTFNLTGPTLPTVTLAPFANVLNTDPAFTLTGGLPSGTNGTYSGPGVGVNGTTFNPANAGVGTHPITYSYTDANGCTNSATRNITVTTAIGNSALIVLDATTDLPLFALTNGLQINKADIGNTPLGIIYKASLNPSGVQFNLTGPINESRYEGPSPHSLFGDIGVNILGKPFPIGNYTLIATPKIGSKITVNFSVTDVNPLCANFDASLSGVTNPSTCSGVGSATAVPSGGASPFTYQWDNGETTATANNLVVGPHSVIVGDANGCAKTLTFTLTGPPLPSVTLTPFASVLNTDAAFTLTGGSPVGGTYSGPGVIGNTFNPAIGVGTYAITYSYTDSNGCSNTATQSITVTTETSNSALLVLDATDDSVLFALTNGLQINKADIGNTPLGIIYNSSLNPGGVTFSLSGPINESRYEGPSPHSLFGDIGENILGKPFPIGNYTLIATPKSGPVQTISFSVIDGLAGNQSPLVAKRVVNEMSIAPNPANVAVTISFDEPILVEEILIFDVTGRLIKTIREPLGLDSRTIDFNVIDLPIGTYFIKTMDSKGTSYQEQMLINRY
ncbi:SdrD B-like domain-containing protein [Maribacter arcticus]|nr:SdrD B-like domain-containing protein [Maribacter arcticus]